MNRFDEIDAMTDQEMQAKIAEHDGFSKILPARFYIDKAGCDRYGAESLWGLKGSTIPKCVPDYLHDLNTMHEFEQRHIVNDLAVRNRYEELVDSISKQHNNDGGTFSSAKQRVKAFLLMQMEDAT